MKDTRSVIIEFDNTSPAEGNQYAQELQQILRRVDPSIEVQQQSTQKGTQDFGATLVLLFGTPVAIALARGIQQWLARTGTSVTIRTATGEIVAKNLNSNNVAELAAALNPHEQG